MKIDEDEVRRLLDEAVLHIKPKVAPKEMAKVIWDATPAAKQNAMHEDAIERMPDGAPGTTQEIRLAASSNAIPAPIKKPLKAIAWNHFKRTFFTVETIACCLFIALFLTEQMPISTPQRAFISLGIMEDTRPIQKGQADNLKDMVKAVARCEGRHPNAIHKELRYRFGYGSYRNIPQSMYFKLKEVLEPRMCDL